MTIPLWTAPFVAGTTTVLAEYLNHLRVNINRVVDGSDGGVYRGAVAWSALHTHTGQIKLSGRGSGIQRRVSTIGNADATLYVTYDIYSFSAAPTVDRTYTLNHTGAPIPEIGQIIRVVKTKASVGGEAIFEREDFTELARIINADNRGHVEFTYTSGGWVASSSGGGGKITAH